MSTTVNADKISKLQAMAAASGPRRKAKKTHKPLGGDDKKLQAAIKKFNSQSVSGIDEVNMFHDDGDVTHFEVPNVQAIVNGNTFVITGKDEKRPLTDFVPGILTQLSPDSIATLRRMAEQHQAYSAVNSDVPEDMDVPELIEKYGGVNLD